jgi:MFS family permease
MDQALSTRTGQPFPALSEHLVLRFGAFTALYAAQGFPYGLLSVAIPAYMAEQGVSPAVIGSFIGITILPWSLKLVNGPIMDRWSFLPMGRRRPWVLAAQAGMVASSVAIGFLPDPLSHMAWLTALGFVLNFFTAFQDVAVDGMAIEIIPIDQQARAWRSPTWAFPGARCCWGPCNGGSDTPLFSSSSRAVVCWWSSCSASSTWTSISSK